MDEKSEVKSGRYQCKKCLRNYSSANSLWNHNNRFHPIPRVVKSTLEGSLSTLEFTSHNVEEGTQIKCNFCDKTFNYKSNKYKHMKNCKVKKEKEQKEVIKNMILEVLNKEGKIHHNTLKKINKNLINSNNNNNNNITNNNNNIVQIIKFGSEDLSSLLSKKELISIFNDKSRCLEKSIELVHLNNERKEYKNLYITNLRNDLMYIFNGEKFEAVNKNETIKELIENHMYNISIKFEDYKKKLNKYTVEAIENFLEEMNNDNIPVKNERINRVFKNYRHYKINEIKLLIYNQKDNKIPTNAINLILNNEDDEDDEQEEEKKIIDV